MRMFAPASKPPLRALLSSNRRCADGCVRNSQTVCGLQIRHRIAVQSATGLPRHNLYVVQVAVVGLYRHRERDGSLTLRNRYCERRRATLPIVDDVVSRIEIVLITRADLCRRQG